MKTAAVLSIALVNAALFLLGVAAALAPDVPVAGRVTSVAVSLGLLAIIGCLALKRIGRLPVWGCPTMRAACIMVPALWLIGSLDRGMISGLEWMSILAAGSLMWVTWTVFKW